jgi:hypothetical protein
MAQNLAASVRARLLNIAKAEQTDFNAVLVRYALDIRVRGCWCRQSWPAPAARHKSISALVTP